MIAERNRKEKLRKQFALPFPAQITITREKKDKLYGPLPGCLRKRKIAKLGNTNL